MGETEVILRNAMARPIQEKTIVVLKVEERLGILKCHFFFLK